MISRPRIASVAALLLVGSLVSGGAVAAPQAERGDHHRRAGVGAAGIGDAYFPQDGNGGIDVLHYGIRDRYDFKAGRLTGRTALELRATQSLDRFNLDFLLPVTRLTVNGRPATFARSGDHELRITPATPLQSGRTYTVLVAYDGIPGDYSSQGESNWLASKTEVVAMNEPHMATWWFPANDHPRDKATYDIRITAPATKQVVANGVQVDRTESGTQATTHWRADEPMASYLAFFAAGSYDVRSGATAGRPWTVAVSKDIPEPFRSDSMSLMLRSGEITNWLESVLGTYPFSVTGGLMTALPVGFALENQTRPTYPRVSSGNVSLVVHELAHQWFGDSVSVDRWKDIWLNEGFATFMEAYYDETHSGPTTQQWLADLYDRRAPFPEFWALEIDDPGKNHIFDTPVYDRGGMALAALRHKIGDTAFFTVLRSWTAQHQYANGTVAQFTALAEATSGQDLDAFFAAWLSTPSIPAKTAANGF